VSLRDKVILELLYATDLRVSELVGLKKRDINLSDDFLIASGKRSKERIVPLGTFARDIVKRIPPGDQAESAHLFREQAGASSHQAGCMEGDTQVRFAARARTYIATHVASHVCNPPP
jgi:site-specific recombinase XerD